MPTITFNVRTSKSHQAINALLCLFTFFAWMKFLIEQETLLYVDCSVCFLVKHRTNLLIKSKAVTYMRWDAHADTLSGMALSSLDPLRRYVKMQGIHMYIKRYIHVYRSIYYKRKVNHLHVYRQNFNAI